MRQCPKCKNYTLKEEHCNEKTLDPHYKYLKIKKEK